MAEQPLRAGITRAGEGQDAVAWDVLGHRYFLKAHGATCFCFETLDLPGTSCRCTFTRSRTSAS